MYDAIYARQSIEKVDSISVESQIDFCRYETRGGNYKEYIDRGFSGKNTNRPAFEEMLSDIEKGLIKKVIVYKLYRISRSILDFSNMMEVFQKYHVEFVSSTEKFDTSTPIGRAMLNIFKCGNCGYALVVRKSDRRRKNVVRYFVCSNKTASGLCKGCGTVRADDLENFMFETIKNKLTEFNVLTNTAKHISDPKINEYKIKISQIDKEIDDLLKKVLTANDILMKYINEHIEKLDEERKQLSEKLISLSSEKPDADMDKITNYISHWNETCLEDKILVVDALIKVIHIADGKIDITWKI